MRIMNTPKRRLFPPVYLLASLLSMAALHRWLPLQQWVVEPWHWLGAILVAAGLLMTALSARRFVRSHTGLIPFTPATTLVTGGFYRFTRNPMYLGMLIILVGMAIYLGSFTPWILPPAFWLVIRQRFVIPEEAFLRDALGQPYIEYCQRVRRWI